MSETRAIKVESCEKCFKGKIYCVYRKELFRGSIHPNCPLPAWPSVDKAWIKKWAKKLNPYSEASLSSERVIAWNEAYAADVEAMLEEIGVIIEEGKEVRDEKP